MAFLFYFIIKHESYSFEVCNKWITDQDSHIKQKNIVNSALEQQHKQTKNLNMRHLCLIRKICHFNIHKWILDFLCVFCNIRCHSKSIGSSQNTTKKIEKRDEPSSSWKHKQYKAKKLMKK